MVPSQTSRVLARHKGYRRQAHRRDSTTADVAAAAVEAGEILEEVIEDFTPSMVRCLMAQWPSREQFELAMRDFCEPRKGRPTTGCWSSKNFVYSPSPVGAVLSSHELAVAIGAAAARYREVVDESTQLGRRAKKRVRDQAERDLAGALGSINLLWRVARGRSQPDEAVVATVASGHVLGSA